VDSAVTAALSGLSIWLSLSGALAGGSDNQNGWLKPALSGYLFPFSMETIAVSLYSYAGSPSRNATGRVAVCF
jgi:hypothetical protein